MKFVLTPWRERLTSIRRHLDGPRRSANRTLPPSSARATLIARADALRDLGQTEAAAMAYHDILLDAGFLTGIRVQYGNMLKDCGRLPEAELAYHQALTESPEDADIHLQLGHVLKLMGRNPAAQTAYRRALELNPLSHEALRELAAAGWPDALERVFDQTIKQGGVETLLTLVGELNDQRARIDELLSTLPDLRSAAAFPIERYSHFCKLFDVPPPPPAVSLVTVLLPAEYAVSATLYQQLAALRAQSHSGWTAAVLGRETASRSVVERAAMSDPRLTWVQVGANETMVAAERRVAQTASPWLLLMAPGAILHPHALGWFLAAHETSGAPAFFCDQDLGDPEKPNAGRVSPVLRQAADYDSLLEANTCGHTIAVDRDTFLAHADRLSNASVTAARSSLLLEMVLRSRIGHLPFPLVWRIAPDDDDQAHREAVGHHLNLSDLTDKIVLSTQDLSAAPRWMPKSPQTEIAVIIPTRDNVIDLASFVTSLQDNARSSAHLSIIVVDNGSGPGSRHRINALQRPGLQILRMNEPFNWSRLNNEAAARTEAPLLVFANDDMQMLTRGWDECLRGLLERPDVGAVGARLLYTDNTIQHAGVLLGWQGSVIHDGLYESAEKPGPNGRWHRTREVGAVTGAFLATRRQDFLSRGGFDANELPVAYSDIDYCLRLRATGLRIIWTPSLSLYHHESKSRGLDHTDAEKRMRNASERRVMEQRWGPALQTEPGIHPMWHDATLPFRLISAASAQRNDDHIRTSAMAHPWRLQGPVA